ncbi:1-deoxy-D-xylulose-5-phosphate reductoisomerase, partial [Paracoccus liaowanqingii]
MRRISIFGATGSVGANGVDLIRHAGGAAAYHTVALTGGRNIALLAQMARELRAEIAVTAHDELLDDLRAALAGSDVAAAAGSAALVEAAARPA